MCFIRLHKYNIDSRVENKYVLTPYLCKDDKIHPVAIICPGGGYKMVCNYMEGTPIAEYLNSKGINAFVLRYRFKDKAKYPNPQDDLTRAINELKDNQDKYHIDMSNYSLWGFSAGGHLCASIGLEYEARNLIKPNCLVLCYPVITLGKHAHSGSRYHLLGRHSSKEDIDKLSIEKHISNSFPRTFIWTGDKDMSVPSINSNMLVEQLKKYNIPYMFKKYHNVGHGVGLANKTNARGWADLAISYWLDK